MTKIEWTDKTWNPIIGCTKISDGCKKCYAEIMANRLSGMKQTEYYKSVVKDGKWNCSTSFANSQIEKPYNWKNPSMVFVCSMSDLFHEKTPYTWINKVFEVMIDNPKHIFQILTKRPERALEYFKIIDLKMLPDHIWLGVTAENQAMANKRIPVLLQIPAKVHFVSCEPLLSNIKFTSYSYDLLNGQIFSDSGSLKNQYGKISWVIAGHETGQKARLMQKEWIESLYEQCKDANVPFFDKKNILGLDLKQFPK